MLYPLKFETIFKDKIWGGQKIHSLLGKDFRPLPNCGETWELSGVSGNVSNVSNGVLQGMDLKSLIGMYRDKLVGGKIYQTFGDEFPLLIKFIDANDDLSIQVHPNDTLASERHNSFGKTEMWYVIQADQDSQLISGFNRELDKETYVEYFESGRLTELLNKEQVADNDVFFLPAGRVHTIGKGLLIAEIQQTSDVTYRIYDFDRKDTEGKLRELHLEEALDAIDYSFYPEYKTTYENKLNKSVELVKCPYFTTNKLELTETIHLEHSTLDSFKIYICIQGSGSIQYAEGNEVIELGDVLLVPAELSQYEIAPYDDLTLLESYVE